MLRKTVVKSSKVLLTLAGIGILFIFVFLLFFSGIASGTTSTGEWARLIYGFEPQIFVAYGFFLLVIGLLPVLTVLDASAKKGVKKLYIHLLLLFSIGILMLIYSALVYGEYLEVFDVLHTWFDYFIIAALLISFSLLPILLSIQNYDRVWNFKLIFALLILVGLILEFISIILYNQTISIQDVTWDSFYLFGLIVLFLGVVPLLLTASPNFRELLHRLRIIWILGTLIGFVLIIVSYLIVSGTIDESLVLNMDWNVILAFSGLFSLLTILPLISVVQLSEIIHKLRFIWVIAFFFGIISVIISAILILPQSFEVEAAIGTIFGTTLLGVSWDIFYMYGMLITILSLSFICSILYFETEEESGPAGLVESVDRLPGIETTPSEMVAYLQILSKSQENMINQFKEAVRADKFRPRVYEKIVRLYQDRNRIIKTRISRFQKAGAAVSAGEEVEALFDVALGEPSEAAPSEPPLPSIAEAVEAPTPPSTPPTGPPIPPAAPPVPPSQAPLPPSPSAAPPTPPSASLGAPPPPSVGVTPSQPSESPLDLIADARSTSIAELRGEMLKELRRLREIFKEE